MSQDELRLIHIEWLLITRWWVFAGIGIAVILNALAAFANYRAIGRVEDMQTMVSNRSIQNTASIDAAMRQMLIYQQETVQYWDKLSKDNSKLKVPRVTVKAPTATPVPAGVIISAAPLSDAELTRPITPKPSPAPAPVKAHKHKPTQTPTPKPAFKWPWSNPKSTR
jgi:hypothetical protein